MNPLLTEQNTFAIKDHLSAISMVSNTANILTTSAAYLDAGLLFVNQNHSFPNRILLENIDCQKAFEWVNNNHGLAPNQIIVNSEFNKSKTFKDAVIILQVDFIIAFDFDLHLIQIFHSMTIELKVNTFLTNISKFQKTSPKHKPEMHLLVTGLQGFIIKKMYINNPKIDLTSNYNEDLMDINKLLLQRLSKKNDKGLVLLHGKPGTGKTSYIRYLMAKLRSKKDIIFLPPNMASAVTNPDLIKILINHRNSIFIIEDAENIVIDREKNETSAVSAILNLADGLLSDCLNIQIICSFNSSISKIDSALLRKGRLIARYEFKELETSKAQLLSNKLGYTSLIDKPTNLANIYNQDEKEFLQLEMKNRIGFVA